MKKYKIYTDGSHLDKLNNGRLGCGGLIIDPGKSIDNQLVDTFTQELSPEFMKLNYGTDKCSNPSAELMGVYCALVHFKKYLKDASEITILADYMGVKEWMTGNWKIKEPYIQRIKNDIDAEIKNQGLQGKITYQWVKGHQSKINKLTNPDAYWNDSVDKLAKGLEDE